MAILELRMKDGQVRRSPPMPHGLDPTVSLPKACLSAIPFVLAMRLIHDQPHIRRLKNSVQRPNLRLDHSLAEEK